MPSSTDHPGASHFFLFGNGPYRNRGCEAIVRGTKAILDRVFPHPLLHVGFSSESGSLYPEVDPDITHFSWRVRRGTRPWLIFQLWKPRLPSWLFAKLGQVLIPFSWPWTAALSVGGDNYSLDYGSPNWLLAMDDLLLARGIPVVIWGASIGPFRALPAYEQMMANHLRKLTLILVRETVSLAYLRSLGVEENVRLVADPAFVMEPSQPPAGKIPFELPPAMAGLNLSPLVMRATLPGQRLRQAAELAEIYAQVSGLPVALVPHVTSLSQNPEGCDYLFLKSLYQFLGDPSRYRLLPDHLNAPETKWVISQCQFFVGARTHATIAAFSSGVSSSIGIRLAMPFLFTPLSPCLLAFCAL